MDGDVDSDFGVLKGVYGTNHQVIDEIPIEE